MAQPDLLAEKILHTDPQVGFGESAVLPYREHPLDTRGYEALERGQERMAMREEARKKNNEDYFHATIKDLPQYRREVDQTMQGMRNDIVNRMVENNKRGVSHTTDSDLQRMIGEYKQAAKDSEQLHKDYETESNKPAGNYINLKSRNGELMNQLTEAYDKFNQGDRSALGRKISANPNLHFNSDEFLNDRYGKIPVSVQSKDQIKNGALGQEIHGDKVSARFWTKDKNGNLIPGIDQSHVEELLNTPTQDPDTLQFREQVKFNAQEAIRNKALQLKNSGDPNYKDLGVEQIASRISSNPMDPHYDEFNKTKLVDNIARQQLEKFQIKSREKDIKSGHAYKTGSGDDNDKLILGENTDVYRNQNIDTSGGSGKSTETRSGWIPREINLNSNKFKNIPLNPNKTINTENAKDINAKHAGVLDYTFTNAYLKPVDAKTGGIIHDSKEAVLKHKNTIVYKWFIEGKREEEKGKHKKEITELIPYDKVETFFKGRGLDLNKDQGPSNLTDKELSSLINEQYPEATDSEKAEVFKKLRELQ
jgi:hypothetical protein